VYVIVSTDMIIYQQPAARLVVVLQVCFRCRRRRRRSAHQLGLWIYCSNSFEKKAQDNLCHLSYYVI
jgi:hypothetical protein